MNVLRTVGGIVSVCVILSLGATACAKKPPAAAAAAPAPPPAVATAPPAPPPPPPPPASAPAPAALSEEEIFARKTLDQLNAERPLADVYFDLDHSTVRDEARGPLQKNAEWLKRWGATRIAIEGHCDERGSSEYNLALGDRRATAIKTYLVSLGVPSDRIAVVSKGKESPFCADHSESCWQENRRGHFVITAK